ncbi:hypothetical protein Vadar_020031 [Vaccinium darrowii]|uniref:Uncharacterized protein n=1 Tax=Vaccinium darrowii TaxID=229202 RepID=A0ACB7Y7S1_9ERIC|nr:hypothetical protein Vadar_020031 [Vaccinium darrowii]
MDMEGEAPTAGEIEEATQEDTTNNPDAEESSPLLPKTRSVQTKVPEVEVHLHRRGKGPIAVFKSALGGWDQDQIELGPILDNYAFKSVFAFNPDSGRGAPIRFHPGNRRSLLPYTDGSLIFIDGEPKVSHHSSQNSNSISFSVYVDNLLYEMDEVWLRQIFRSYGDVVDVFIPNKRSSRFNTKFGFVRFRSRAEALDAVQDLHGIRIRDFRVQKKASMSRALGDDKCPFADIVAGKRPSVTTTSIKVQDEGDQWLSMSAIAKLPSQRLIESLREAFIAEGVWTVQVVEEQVGVTSFVKTICECAVDKKGQNKCRANPYVVLHTVNESGDNSICPEYS